MSKRVKFPLIMADGEQVRNIEDLRKYFDLVSVLDYYNNGKLIEWLYDRYYEEEARKINALDSSSVDFKNRLCDILGATYSENEADGVRLDEIAAKNERRNRLKMFTADDNILAAADNVAFTQEELADLIDENVKLIYLCGEYFKIPGSKQGITYVGVNSPTVDAPAEYEKKGIVFQNIDLAVDTNIGIVEEIADKLGKSSSEIKLELDIDKEPEGNDSNKSDECEEPAISIEEYNKRMEEHMSVMKDIIKRNKPKGLLDKIKWWK